MADTERQNLGNGAILYLEPETEPETEPGEDEGEPAPFVPRVSPLQLRHLARLLEALDADAQADLFDVMGTSASIHYRTTLASFYSGLRGLRGAIRERLKIEAPPKRRQANWNADQAENDGKQAN